MKKKIFAGLLVMAAVVGMAFAEVTYCVTVRCSKCDRVYEQMDVSGSSQSDCERKAMKFACGHAASYKRAVSAKGYCPRID